MYTAIGTDQLMKEINMLFSIIKATEPNIKNVISLSKLILIYLNSETRLFQYSHVDKALPHSAIIKLKTRWGKHFLVFTRSHLDPLSTYLSATALSHI